MWQKIWETLKNIGKFIVEKIFMTPTAVVLDDKTEVTIFPLFPVCSVIDKVCGILDFGYAAYFLTHGMILWGASYIIIGAISIGFGIITDKIGVWLTKEMHNN